MLLLRLTIISLLVPAALAAGTQQVAADQGVSVDLGSIALNEKLSPGGQYRLPTLTVRNIGDEAGEYEIVIIHMNDADDEDAPEQWFDFQPSRFFLEPNQAQKVQLRIGLPTGADPGRYEALIEAHATTDGDGVRIRAAAASRVSFEVKPSTIWQAWLLQLRREFADHSPWSYVVPAVVLALVLVYLWRRYVNIGIRFERRY
jgi:hypothetical protein